MNLKKWLPGDYDIYGNTTVDWIAREAPMYGSQILVKWTMENDLNTIERFLRNEWRIEYNKARLFKGVE